MSRRDIDSRGAAFSDCAACPPLVPINDELDPIHPIRNVSWLDAKAYTDWLSERTGFSYRLPTEAEWEFAARAGTSSKYWWGDQFEPDRANCTDCGADYDRKVPALVNQVPSNPWTIYGMNGGVAEWSRIVGIETIKARRVTAAPAKPVKTCA